MHPAFLHIADYNKAQQLLDQQLDTRFAERVNSFVPQVFPTMQDAPGSYYSYCWPLWQSEWAADLVFSSPDKLESVMSSLLRYAHIIGTSTGIRLRHWVDQYSVKMYNEQNVLRVETTINDPGKFKVFRHKF